MKERFEVYVSFVGKEHERQLKSFESIGDFCSWCSRNSEKIMKANGIFTNGVKLSESDAEKIANGRVPKVVIEDREKTAAAAASTHDGKKKFRREKGK